MKEHLNMPWPNNDLAKCPNLTSKEWKHAVHRGNPDRHLPEELRHDTYTTGRGPDAGWSHEQQYGGIANMRAIRVIIPDGFPRITAENLFAPGVTADIYGMAAPSPATDRALVDAGIIKGMVNFLGNRKEIPTNAPHLPYLPAPWKDFAGNDQALDCALQLARCYLTAPRQDPAEIPAVVFHCAWGLGRTGTALAAYQLMNNIMVNRDNSECQDYLKESRMTTARVTVHGDQEKGQPAHIYAHTTPGVALAINQIRRSTNPPMVAVETLAQVRMLEKYENRIAQAMCEADSTVRPFPGAAQQSVVSRWFDVLADEQRHADSDIGSIIPGQQGVPQVRIPATPSDGIRLIEQHLQESQAVPQEQEVHDEGRKRKRDRVKAFFKNLVHPERLRDVFRRDHEHDVQPNPPPQRPHR
jgi:hypothetical protein